MGERKLVSFDWAMKKILRDKENFCILEGFLSELLFNDITILEILESESNPESRNDKHNRVDIKVKNSAGELIIVEVQYSREDDFLHRLLYSTSKTITEHMSLGMEYSEIKKVISVSILYFDLGAGEDYIYRGQTSFEGIHNHSILKLNDHQKLVYGIQTVPDIFPEYYLINLKKYHDETNDTLDEWIYFLKNGEIKDGFHARGLLDAKEKLRVMSMKTEDRQKYDRYVEDLRDEASWFKSTYIRGAMEGREEGREEERIRQEQIRAKEIAEMERKAEKEKHELILTMARQLKSAKTAIETIILATGLSESEIEAL